MDPRLEKLAHNLVNYSVAVKPGDKVWINYIGEKTHDLATALVKEVYAAGGIPFPHSEDQRIHREILMGCTKEQLDIMCETDSFMMSKMDCFIGVRAADNASELSDVPSEKISLYNKLYSSPVHHGIRVPKTRWVVLRFPTDAMAQTLPSEFEPFWISRNKYDITIGYRNKRRDGMSRVFVTRVLRLVVYLCFRVNVLDANTPYRIMSAATLKDNLEYVPDDFFLTNVALSAIYKKRRQKVHFIPITFRPRQGGTNSINIVKIIKVGLSSIKSFLAINDKL